MSKARSDFKFWLNKHNNLNVNKRFKYVWICVYVITLYFSTKSYSQPAQALYSHLIINNDSTINKTSKLFCECVQFSWCVCAFWPSKSSSELWLQPFAVCPRRNMCPRVNSGFIILYKRMQKYTRTHTEICPKASVFLPYHHIICFLKNHQGKSHLNLYCSQDKWV